MKNLLALLVAAGTIAAATAASASQFPASVVGGPWTWNANQSGVAVTVTSQDSSGACDQILGTMQAVGTSNIADMQGYYCPSTGQISMLRKDRTTHATYQVWSGQVDAQPTLSLAYAGGTFLSIGTGLFAGEFFFSGAFSP